jgi:phage baseplate assembly protein W
MEGYSPKLPLVKDVVDGLYSMNKTALESIKQDLKMLLMTNPGERIMNPDYGVGIRQLLFSQNTPSLRSEIISRINNQVKKYMSFIVINDIRFEQTEDFESNSLYVVLDYSVPSARANDTINLDVSAN